jgi:hypothetical protein
MRISMLCPGERIVISFFVIIRGFGHCMPRQSIVFMVRRLQGKVS